jgi:hypothetical protein
MASKFFQAFKQAPWRVQLQKIGLVLLGLACFAFVAGLYLNISANTYEIGVQVQRLEATKESLQRGNADFEAQQAELLSSTRMQQKSGEVGFVTPDPQTYQYVMIENYNGREVNIPSPKVGLEAKHFLLKPEYRQSLWEYLFQGILSLGQSSGVWSR